MLSFNDLPDAVCYDTAAKQRSDCLYTYLSKPLISSLASFLAGKNVLEVFAGRGHLSALLREQGTSVIATSLRSSHDGSDVLGHAIEVEEIGVIEAVSKYGSWIDILLVAWPTTTGEMHRALTSLRNDALIVFIGEVTDYSTSPPFLGGCATDAFFNAVEEVPEMTQKLRYPTPRLDKIKVFKRSK
ncbi:TPA: hypothetical protein L4559_005139 [Pseudomonas aeruginosa]|nr:hypothetical protein [Pseudomonas aeruginosa]